MAAKSLHILLLDPHSDGGGQVRYVSNLAGQLQHLGHRVTIGCRKNSILEEVAAEHGAGCLNRFHFARGLRLFKWMADMRALRAFVAAEGVDIVHANSSQDHWVAALACRVFQRRVCVVRTRHNTYPVRRGLANRILNRYWTDYQIVVCEEVRQTLASHPAFIAHRLCAIHNGVDATRFAPNPAVREEVRREFGYTDDDVVCGIAARLVAAKGHIFLFKALAQVRDTCPALKVLVLGQGPLEAELRALVDRLGLSARVQFAGYRVDMERCVQAVDFGAQPSIDCDTSSFSMKEQMAAGKAVIASDYGGLKEILRDGVEGFVVPTGTVEPIAQGLRQLTMNPALRIKMGEQGRKHILREFTLEVYAQRTADAYRRALSLFHRAGAVDVL
ncbi:MAG: glycosyltransferase family 4 protein [Candidatus Hydrogenedentes bacterium]|nr:glycosyltransferase family 4 protein [Candidatus Hydrogenedentota bacterium]